MKNVMKNKDFVKKLDVIKKAILDTVEAKYIYLFGSYVYGEPNSNSDIDIYVVIPDSFNDRITFTMGKIANYLYDYKIFTADLFLVKESKFLEYKEYHSFEQTVYEKGVLIYGH
jgi:predicted nucleotidyltransferase